MTVGVDITREQPSRWERPALASGIAFAALQLAAIAFVIAILLPRMAPIDAPLDQHAEFYREHATMLRITNYLLTLPMPFFLLFLGGLFGVLRRVEGGSGALAITAIASGVAMAMIWPFGILLSGVGTDIVPKGGDVATARAFDAMAPLSLALSAFPRAVLLVATSVLVLDSRIVPRWMGWLGLVLAVVSLIGTATLIVGDLFPLLALGTLIFELWILALSVVLVRSGSVSSQRAALAPA